MLNSASISSAINPWKEMVRLANIGIRLPEQEKAMLAVRADRNETTISDIVRKLIRNYLRSEAPQQEKEHDYE